MIASCTQSSSTSENNNNNTNSSVNPYNPGPISPSMINKSVAPIAFGNAHLDTNYTIMPMDKLDITVFQLPEFSRTIEVSQSGTISLPLIGIIQASGFTVEQLQKRIEEKLAADYLQNPQVTVSVKEYANRNITVSGQIIKPGVFPIRGETTLLQAIAMGGGMTNIGDPSSVLVFRNNGTGRSVARFNVNSINQGKDPDPLMQPGDIIIVESSQARTFLRDTREILPFVGIFLAIAAM